MIIYLIRHAESQANTQGIYQGQTFDTGLSEKGKQQAQSLISSFQGNNIGSIFSSPCQRTYQTALPLSRVLKKPVTKDQLLLEINHGTWEGKHIGEFTPQEKQILNLWKTKPHQVQMSQGENLQDVVKRCQAFFTKIKSNLSDTIVITHDAVIRVIICLYSEIKLEDLWSINLTNCGITKIDLSQKQVVAINQIDHLNGILSTALEQAL